LKSAELRKLILKGESETLEFKLAFGKDVIETLCGFANHRGGFSTPAGFLAI
jgi:predicted HTH transcriptional regulator